LATGGENDIGYPELESKGEGVKNPIERVVGAKTAGEKRGGDRGVHREKVRSIILVTKS